MIEITKIEENDLAGLALLLEELSEMATDRQRMEYNFRLISGDDNYVLLGARYDGRLAGSLMGIFCHDLVGECRPFIVIENVIVSEAYRGQGIGRALMNKIEDMARDRNCLYSMLVSGAARTGAHRFYEAAGYGVDAVKGYKKFL